MFEKNDDGLHQLIAYNRKDAHVMQHMTTSGMSDGGVAEDACTHAAFKAALPGQKGGVATVRVADSRRVTASRERESGTGTGQGH